VHFIDLQWARAQHQMKSRSTEAKNK
jgi:hypothetical protein